MKQFDNGVRFYGVYTAHLTVSFPEDDICCRWCSHCRSERDLGRARCGLTGEVLFTPEISNAVGARCPINFTRKEDN